MILSVPVTGQGEDYYHAAVARGLEGIMAKRINGRYEPGLRSDNWLKIKSEMTCDCVIAGYTKGQGGRSPTFGALILGLYENRTGIYLHRAGQVRYLRWCHLNSGLYISAMSVQASQTRIFDDLMSVFSSLKTSTPQFAIPGHKDMVWLEPVLVAEIAYQEVTGTGN